MSSSSEYESSTPLFTERVNKNQCPQINDDTQNFSSTAFSSNSNAKETSNSPNRLKKMFPERQSHKVLAEQKVSEWLVKNRIYGNILPKDMMDIPETLLLPVDSDLNSKNSSASITNTQ
ncbi:unnamed protein product [Hymenolepis diminuta]|uniref:Uncharacterized protein n=1 Tax=Hymenolepis diminuta TaxID=6216 RepID=A0A0R3S968_HYMDI|nr:unnamed protein product [Hymenolepis diminuta]VUZ47368.1 unnamed protein product [Hymenolepis diminuta]